MTNNLNNKSTNAIQSVYLNEKHGGVLVITEQGQTADGKLLTRAYTANEEGIMTESRFTASEIPEIKKELTNGAPPVSIGIGVHNFIKPTTAGGMQDLKALGKSTPMSLSLYERKLSKLEAVVEKEITPDKPSTVRKNKMKF